MQICREIPGDPTSYRRGWGRSSQHRGDPRPHGWDRWCLALAIAVGIGTAAMSATAHAGDGEPPPQAQPTLRASSDLDGGYLYLGPVGAAISIDGAWDGAFGASLSWLRVREHRPVAAAGVSLGAARYSARDGGRVWLEGIAGTRRVLGVLAGITAGPLLELGDVQHARPGVTGGIWLFAGVTPFVRAGFVAQAGGFVEAGLQVPLPVWRF